MESVNRLHSAHPGAFRELDPAAGGKNRGSGEAEAFYVYDFPRNREKSAETGLF
jgi:hypothetical protein